MIQVLFQCIKWVSILLKHRYETTRCHKPQHVHPLLWEPWTLCLWLIHNEEKKLNKMFCVINYVTYVHVFTHKTRTPSINQLSKRTHQETHKPYYLSSHVIWWRSWCVFGNGDDGVRKGVRLSRHQWTILFQFLRMQLSYVPNHKTNTYTHS